MVSIGNLVFRKSRRNTQRAEVQVSLVT
jgi:hypothetical protein